MFTVACLESGRSLVRTPLWYSSFKETILLHSFTKIHYSGESQRGSVLGLRPPWLEFRILCLEIECVSVILLKRGLLIILQIQEGIVISLISYRRFSWPSLAYIFLSPLRHFHSYNSYSWSERDNSGVKETHIYVP